MKTILKICAFGICAGLMAGVFIGCASSGSSVSSASSQGSSLSSANTTSSSSTASNKFENKTSGAVSNSESQANVSEVLNEYKARYGATRVFQDLFVSQKYFLPGKDGVVQLMLLNNYVSETSIPYDSIARVEANSIDDFETVKVCDKTGNVIEISLNQVDAKALMNALPK